MEIRSYRRVFDLERRVYSIDSLRLNPGGVPVRGILYFVAVMAAMVVVARLPLIGALGRALPWYIRDLGLPGATATVLGMLRLEGRTFHVAAMALLRFWVEPRHLMCLRRCEPFGRRWHPQEMLLVPDGSEGALRRLRYRGPGAVLVAIEHELTERCPLGPARGLLRRYGLAGLTLREGGGRRGLEREQVILLAEGARMRVRGGTSDGRRPR
jgi:hypothetical protein